MNYSASAKVPFMPEPRRSAAAKLAPADVEWVAAAVGRSVRAGRAKRGMTRRQLAHASGASERYLAQIEAGAGNPSVIVLAAVAEALVVPISDLLPRPKGRMPAMARILDLVARAPASELPMIAELLEACTGDASLGRSGTAHRAYRPSRGRQKHSGTEAGRPSSAFPSSSSTRWSSRSMARPSRI